MTHKINLGSVLIALFLFFLPWIDFQCSGKTLITQSGVQSVYGGGSLSDELEAMAKKNGGSEDSQESMGIALMVGIGFLATLVAVGIGVLAYREPNKYPEHTVAVLSGVALLCILIQMSVGFPIKKEMYEKMGGKEQKEQADNPFSDMGEMMGAMSINIEYTNAFYLCMIALGIPVGVQGKRLLDKKKI